MKNHLIFCLIFMGFVPIAFGQQVINKRYAFDHLARIITSIHPTDSCLYIKGLMRDSSFNDGLFIAKMTVEGDVIWKKDIINSYYDMDSWGDAMEISPSGNFIITGYQYPKDTAGMEGYVMEITPNGEVVKHTSFLTPFIDHNSFIVPHDVIALSKGGYAVTGNLGPKMDGEPSRAFLARFDDSLHLLSMQNFSGNETFLAYTLAENEDGSLLIGGYEITNYQPHSVKAEKRISKIDSTGTSALWTWKHPSNFPAYWKGGPVRDLLKLPDGSLVGASAISKILFNGFFEYPVSIPSIFKLNADRTLAWERKFGNGYFAQDIFMRQVVQANEADGFVGAGHVDFPVTTYSQLGIIAKVSHTGDSLWMRYFDFFDDDIIYREHFIYELKPAIAGAGYWLAGEAKAQLPGEIYQQGWLLKVDNYGCLVPGCQLVSAAEAPLTEKIRVYPNPAQEYVVVDHSGHSFSQGRFRLVSAAGMVQKEWTPAMDDLSTVVGLENVPPGSYFVQYVEDGVVKGSKAVVRQ